MVNKMFYCIELKFTFIITIQVKGLKLDEKYIFTLDYYLYIVCILGNF